MRLQKRPSDERSNAKTVDRAGSGGASSLFLTVILVMVVMMLAVTAAVLSNTQFRLAGNLQFENIAFNLAEGAVASAGKLAQHRDPCQGRRFHDLCKLDAAGLSDRLLATNNPRSADDDLAGHDEGPTSAGDQRYLIEKYGADNQPLGTGLDTGGRPLTGCQKVDVFPDQRAGQERARHAQVRPDDL
jgi:hypothetical protein